MKKICNYIGGKLVNPVDGKYMDNYCPSNGKPYSLVPVGSEDDVSAAINCAKRSFENWGSSTREYRYGWLMKLADAIDKNLEKLALAESLDNGKPEWLAKKIDIPRCAANLRFFATAILHLDSKSHNMDGEAMNYTIKQPIGVAGCISPWNLPLYLLTWKIAPALAAGNTVVAKPSEITPYTAYLFSEICIDIGFPEGVINIVHGQGDIVGASIVKNCDVVSFTGGTDTGRLVAANAAHDFKKCSLELGGKNPTIVFGDADFDLSVKNSVKSAFLNQGQICLCGSRVFVEESIYDSFKKSFIKEAKMLKVGCPKEVSTNLGAIVSEKHLNSIFSKIENAIKNGAIVAAGGKRVVLPGDLSSGYFMEPTVLLNTKNTDSINQEEVFGPVVTIMPFKNEKDLIKMCNDVKYGLSASIFSQNISKANRVAAKINAGVVWINTWLLRDLRIPFGGMKGSGLGREGGYYSLDFFTETKNVCFKIEKDDNK
tara:strand:+ start:13373 stop:14827 length:1455 start_codon:yes stop_codon:yes gene_type:complete